MSASSTSSAFDHEPGRVASITSTFDFEPGRVTSLTSTFVQILTIYLRFLRFLRSFWTFLGHFGVFLGYFSVFWSIFDQCLPMFVYVRFFGWGSCLKHRLRSFLRTSSRIDNVNVRPNVNNDINVNVNVRPNFAVWTMKRSSTFANEDSSRSYTLYLSLCHPLCV